MYIVIYTFLKIHCKQGAGVDFVPMPNLGTKVKDLLQILFFN